jgi:DNA-binding transcriptional LysR family regulator
MLNQIDLSRFDLNLLVLFETVSQERNVARAATRLNISASAVSHGLKRLREALGDPLFVRNPRGVTPTARAAALAPSIAEILAQVRGVVAADRFDPKTSRRRFAIGASDGISAVVLPKLLADLSRSAPGIDVSVRDILPPFESATAELDERRIDIAIFPLEEVPARFMARRLYPERFVVAMRAGHKLARGMTLKQYCSAAHMLVSHTGAPRGYIDDDLEKRGLSRRVALTAPNFMLALSMLSDTDLLAAVPEGLARAHAKRFDLAIAPLPTHFPAFPIQAIAPAAAMSEAGLAWMMERLTLVALGVVSTPVKRGKR